MLPSVFGQAKGYGFAIAVLLFAKGSAKDNAEGVILQFIVHRNAKSYGYAIAVLLFAKGSAKDNAEGVILPVGRQIPNPK